MLNKSACSPERSRKIVKALFAFGPLGHNGVRFVLHKQAVIREEGRSLYVLILSDSSGFGKALIRSSQLFSDERFFKCIYCK